MEIIISLKKLGMPADNRRAGAWLRQRRNFVAAREAALRLRGVGPRTWREFLARYGLGEEYLPIELERVEADVTEYVSLYP